MAEKNDAKQSDGTKEKTEITSRDHPSQVYPVVSSQPGYPQLSPQQPVQQYTQQEAAVYGGYGQNPGVQYQLHANPGSQPVMQQPVPMQTTTMVIQQQQALATVAQNKAPRDWSTGMCSCCESVGVCLAVCFCSECYACFFMKRVHESCCLPCCFPLGWMAAVRAKIRGKYNIEGTLMKDFCLTSGPCFCFTRQCVFCQMIREVNMMESQGNLM